MKYEWHDSRYPEKTRGLEDTVLVPFRTCAGMPCSDCFFHHTTGCNYATNGREGPHPHLYPSAEDYTKEFLTKQLLS